MPELKIQTFFIHEYLMIVKEFEEVRINSNVYYSPIIFERRSWDSNEASRPALTHVQALAHTILLPKINSSTKNSFGVTRQLNGSVKLNMFPTTFAFPMIAAYQASL